MFQIDLFVVVHPALPLLTMGSPTLQDVLRDGFGKAVMACDVPEPCKFPSLDSCQKRLLWTHKEVNLASCPVVGLVLQVVDAVRFFQVLGFESLDPFFFQSQLSGSMFHSYRGGWRGQETCTV